MKGLFVTNENAVDLSGDLRWETVLELEAIAANELRLVESAVPEFYQWLSEEVLPMEG